MYVAIHAPSSPQELQGEGAAEALFAAAQAGHLTLTLTLTLANPNPNSNSNPDPKGGELFPCTHD